MHRLEHDQIEVAHDALLQLPGCLLRALEVFVHTLARRLDRPLIGQAPSEHQVENHAQSVDVAAGVGPARELFGAGICGCKRSAIGCREFHARGAKLFGDAEVEQLDHAFG